jgi:hypothetical protein
MRHAHEVWTQGTVCEVQWSAAASTAASPNPLSHSVARVTDEQHKLGQVAPACGPSEASCCFSDETQSLGLVTESCPPSLPAP